MQIQIALLIWLFHLESTKSIRVSETHSIPLVTLNGTFHTHRVLKIARCRSEEHLLRTHGLPTVMLKVFCRTLLPLIVWATSPLCSVASNYVYMIDTSRSMRTYRKALPEAVIADVDRALANGSYAPGDRVYVWSFTADVSELLKIDYKAGSETDLRVQIESKMKRLKLEGLTSIAKPLIKALEQFGPRDTGDLHFFVYTDGRDAVSAPDGEKILRLYNHGFKQHARLRQATLIQFGNEEPPKTTQALIAGIGGRTVLTGHAPEITAAPKTHLDGGAEKVVPSTIPTTISVMPVTIQFSIGVAPEIVKPVPLEFTVAPTQPGLLIGLALETGKLPDGMSVSTTSDRLATEGRQSVDFLIRNAPAGHYSAKLKLSGPVTVRPDEIPIDFEIVPVHSNEIGLQFYPEHLSLIEVSTGDQWQSVPNVGLSLFYPPNLSKTLVRFDSETPQGVELQILPGKEAGQAIAIGRLVNLSDLGHTVRFQMRQISSNIVGKSLSAKLSVHVQSGQGVKVIGTNRITLPFGIVSPLEVQIETPELALGDIAPGKKAIKTALALRVKGQPLGKKVRVVKQGTELASITVTPNEIVLKPGLMQVDLEFSGFDGRPPGNVAGTLVLVPTEEGPLIKMPSAAIPVRGRIPELAKIIAEVENPMVSGQPLVIHARFDSGERGSISVAVHPPDSKKIYEIALADSGAAADGDAKANDGVFSGLFKQTGPLGKYQLTVTGKGTNNSVQNASLTAPFYFKAPTSPLLGSMAKRKQTELIQFKPMIISEFPGKIAIHEESATSKSGLPTFLSNKDFNKSLERGENPLNLSVELARDIQPGDYKYQIYLVTDLIEGTRAKIPLSFEINVLSFFQYFVRMLAIALAVAAAAFLAIVAPWKKIHSSQASKKALPPTQSSDNPDDSFA